MPRRAALTIATTSVVDSLRGFVPKLREQRAILLDDIARKQRDVEEIDKMIASFGRAPRLGGPTKEKKAKRAKRKPPVPTQPVVLEALGRRAPAGGHTVASLVSATKLTKQQVYNALSSLIRAKKVTRDGEGAYAAR